MKKKPIQQRIREAIGNEKRIAYQELLNRVFPHSEYPRAMRNHIGGGGPPGCAMALGAAISRMGGCRDKIFHTEKGMTSMVKSDYVYIPKGQSNEQ